MTFSVKAMATLVFVLLAFSGNMLNLPLFFGVHFIFGSVAVMLAVKLLGLWPAVCVAVAGGAYTWVLWGHPYAMLTFTLEALVVSLLYRRGMHNLVLADLVFWLLAGPTLVPLFYAGVLGLDTSSTGMIAFKQSLNGLFNALIAGILIKAIVWRFQNGSVGWLPPHIRLNELLFHILLTLTLIAGATPIIINSYTDKSEQEQILAGQLKLALNATTASLQRQPDVSPVYIGVLLEYALNTTVSGIALLNERGEPIAQAGEVKAFSPNAVQPLGGASNLRIWLPDSGGSLVNRWKSGVFQYRLPITGLPDGTELLAETPAAPLVQAVENQRNKSFAFLAAMTLLSILIAFLLSRILTRPLEQLGKASKQLPEMIRLQKQPELPVSRVKEYRTLSASLQTMSDTLATAFGELNTAKADLELEVQARTRELSRTSSMLINILEASTELAIIATDTQGLITLFNKGAENLLKYDSSEMIGVHSLEVIHRTSEIEERAKALFEQTGEQCSRFEVFVKVPLRQGSETREWSYVNKHGQTLPVTLTVTPIRNDEDELTGFLGIAQDISERKRIDQVKSEFISIVSHELRTPLTSITGAIGLVLGGRLGDIPGKARTLLNTANRNSIKLGYLINDLLDIEKIAAGKMHFDFQTQLIHPILEQSVDENKTYSARQNVKLTLSSELDEAWVKVDENRLKQALANLFSNAIKFSPDGGTVTVRVASADEAIMVSVTDQGPGIPEEFLSRIFQKFAQADSSDTRAKGGTGLGLAITRELIERMGGTIGFESAEGKGSRFFFTLPSVRPGQTRPTKEQPVTRQSNPLSPRILVVEDDPDVAELLKLMLAGAGYKVSVCLNGSQALEAVKTGHYDLISLDLMLPDISGLDIIRHLKQQADTADIPIVVVSAKVEQGRLELNSEADNIGWLAKPIDHQKLIDLVQHQLLDGGRPRILHVEDDTDLHNVVAAMVSDQLILEQAGTVTEAKVLLKQNVYEAVLLDIGLPDGSGWELIPEIESELPGAAIVILSGEDFSKESHPFVESVLLKNRLTTEQLISVIQNRIHQRQSSASTSSAIIGRTPRNP